MSSIEPDLRTKVRTSTKYWCHCGIRLSAEEAASGLLAAWQPVRAVSWSPAVIFDGTILVRIYARDLQNTDFSSIDQVDSKTNIV